MPQMAYCSQPVTLPPPCKTQANLRPAGSHSDYPPSGHDSVISHSYSNTARDARSSSTSQSMQVPPGIPAHVTAPEPTASGGMMCKDPEKQADFPTSNGRRSRNHMPSNGPDDLYYQSDVDDSLLEDKALGILFHLSGFCCFLSFIIFLWTAVAVFLAALLQPLRFCSMRPDYREQLVKFLGPPLNLQFRYIYAPPVSSMYNTPLLLMVHLLSPFVAMGIAFAAWISAAFWIYAAIIGDPGSRDGHNDGRESVLMVRSYWERWLLHAVR